MASFAELKVWNTPLWADGVCRGEISYSEVGALATGNIVTNLIAESFLNGPNSPVNVAFDPTGSIPLGPSDSYPKPWRSASQKLQDSTYGSQIGPFARLVSIKNNRSFSDTCVDGCGSGNGGGDPCSIGLFGRLGLSSDGTLGFRLQDWYNQNEGPYGAAYFNEQNGTNWHTWKQWWDGASKATIYAGWDDYPGSPTVEVEVAYDVTDLGDPDWYPGQYLGLAGDASIDLLVAMVAIAAAARWIF